MFKYLPHVYYFIDYFIDGFFPVDAAKSESQTQDGKTETNPYETL